MNEKERDEKKGWEEKEERVVEGKEEGKRKRMERRKRRTGWVGRAPVKKKYFIISFEHYLSLSCVSTIIIIHKISSHYNTYTTICYIYP